MESLVNMQSDSVLRTDLVVEQSTYIDVRVLPAATKRDHDTPSGANYVLFSANGDFYYKRNGGAVVPSSDVTNGSGPELNPTIRYIGGSTTISLISPSSCVITMAFYA